MFATADYTKLVAAEMECTSNVGLLCDGKHTGVKHTITTIAMIITIATATATIKEIISLTTITRQRATQLHSQSS